MQTERASKKQQELLEFIAGFISEHGYGPSYREVMRALNYKSVSTVAVHVDGLIKKGYLTRRDKSARSLEVVRTAPNEASTVKPSLEQELQQRIEAADLTNEQKTTIIEALALVNISIEQPNS